MTGLLFLVLPLLVLVWAGVCWKLLRPVDVRPARPRRQLTLSEHMEKLRLGFELMQRAFSQALLPTMMEATKAMNDFHRAIQKANVVIRK